MPVESEPAVAEIHFHKIRLTVKGKSTRVKNQGNQTVTAELNFIYLTFPC